MKDGAVLVLGGTSTIARALAAQYAQAGRPLLLAGRDLPELERSARDLGLRYGVPAEAVSVDLADPSHPAPLLEALCGIRLHGVVWAFGTMRAARGGAPEELRESAFVNFGAAPLTIEAVRPLVAPQGFIALLSSVAGDRGRQANYVYGAAKAGLGTYGLGLRHLLQGGGPSVTVVRLGVVDTQMTWGLPGARGAADPERVAREIVRGVARRRAVIYVPRRWALIMLVLRHLPEPVFNRLRI